MVAAALAAALACPAQPALIVERRPGEVRTAVVACDGDRRVVLRRARLERGGSGTRVVAVAGAGPWVAWGELHRTRGRVFPTVVRSRIAHGRARVMYDGLSRARPPRLEVVVSSRGGLAWLVGRAVYTTRGFGRYTSSAWQTARGPLVLEEDRTVRWREPGGLLGFENLHGAPCGPRPGYRVVAEDEEMLVTDTVYDGRLRVIRACGRDDGDDDVIVQARTDDRLELVGLDDPWAIFTRTSQDGSCTIESYLPHYDTAIVAPVPCDRVPAPGGPIAVAVSEMPVWIHESSALLMAVRGRIIEVDRTAPGGLTGLTAEGFVVRWLHDGRPRSVTFGP
jgi:hypothetical protein